MTVNPNPRRLGAEGGQTSIEWLGVAFVVVAVIVALVVLSPGMGSRVEESFACLVSRVTGDGAACAGGPTARSGEPDFPCVVHSVEGSASLGGRIVVVDVETGQAFVRETMSDGTVRVTFVESNGLGASARLGGGVSGDLNGVGGGGRASAEAGGLVMVEGGDTRVFTDPDEADQYIQDRTADAAIDALPVPLGLPLAGIRGLLDALTGHETPMGEAGSTNGGVSLSLGVDAEGNAGPALVRAEALVGAGADVALNPDGSMEVRLIVEGSGSADASVVGVGGQVGVEGSGAVTVSVDATGTPTAVQLDVLVGTDLAVGPLGALPVDGLEQAIGDLVGGAGGQAVVSVSLDLTDPGLLTSAGDARDTLSAALAGAADTDDLAGSVVDVLGEAADALTITLVVNDVRKVGAGLEADGNVGIGVGAEVGVDLVTTEIASARYWDPGQGRFVPWITCTR